MRRIKSSLSESYVCAGSRFYVPSWVVKVFEAVTVTEVITVFTLLCLLCDHCHNMMAIMSVSSTNIDCSILQMAAFLWTQPHISLLHQILDV